MPIGRMSEQRPADLFANPVQVARGASRETKEQRLPVSRVGHTGSRRAVAGIKARSVRQVVETWLEGKIAGVGLGLPEYDDRIGQWRVALLAPHNGGEAVGEVRVADDGAVVFWTDLAMAKTRCRRKAPVAKARHRQPITFRPIPSRIVLGDASHALSDYPPGAVQLVFTSPPYFNAKPEYHESEGYVEYLALLRDVFTKCHDILSDGRFLVVNTSPVLIRRTHRNASSRRLPITFDLHAVLDAIGFEFVDDIIWQKPEGAGWHLGRGRRFAADRQPLQYKAVTVTENVVVYRKRTDKLIDWNLRNHPDKEAIQASLIADGYERTNIWQLHPAHHKAHPAVFPEALAERVIRYYSFAGDMVLDPFSGAGTTGRVAGRLKRRFFLVEKNLAYFDIQRHDKELRAYQPDVMDYEFFAGSD